MSFKNFNIQPVAGRIGAEIVGVDLSADLIKLSACSSPLQHLPLLDNDNHGAGDYHSL